MGRNNSLICTYLIYGTELCHIPLPNFVDIGRLDMIEKSIILIFVNTVKQAGVNDCGLFAIAYATAL